MNRKVLLRLAGLILGPILIIAIGTYVLYPFIKQEKYSRITEKFDRKRALVVDENFRIGRDYQTVVEQVKLLRGRNKQLQAAVDSLSLTNRKLGQKLKEEAKQDSIDRARLSQRQRFVGQEVTQVAQPAADVADEDLSEKIKGLLSLDEENLSPIVNILSDDLLFQLYQEGNTIQRKKLLRSLKAERAAKLMSRVML